MSILQRNRVEVFLHFVWTTEDRQALLVEDVERVCYRCIGAQAKELECTILALNGLPDHVHLLVTFPRDTFPSSVFQWAEGYGVFAVGREYLPAVIAYIENQKQRHAERQLEEDWEEPRITISVASGGRSAEGH